MSIVKINALDISEGHGEEFLARFSARPGNIEKADGFEGFQVLRPTDSRATWLVVTRWRDEAAYDAWFNKRPPRDPKTITYADGWDVWSFDVVTDVFPQS